MDAFVGILAIFLSVAFLAAAAILQPGLFGTLGLYILACVIFLAGVSIRCLIVFRAGKSQRHNEDGEAAGIA